MSVYIVNSVHIFISLYLCALWFKRNKESESEEWVQTHANKAKTILVFTRKELFFNLFLINLEIFVPNDTSINCYLLYDLNFTTPGYYTIESL